MPPSPGGIHHSLHHAGPFPLLLLLQNQKETRDEKDRSSEGRNWQATPQGCVSCPEKEPSAPSPTHAPPVIQMVLVLLHFPTARVAAVYQAVGSEVHAVNLCHQGLHLLVQDVKPDMHREGDWGQSTGTLPTAQSLECGALAFSFHLLNTFDQVRGQKGRRYADIPIFWFMGPISWFSISWTKLVKSWLLTP